MYISNWTPPIEPDADDRDETPGDTGVARPFRACTRTLAVAFCISVAYALLSPGGPGVLAFLE